MNQERNPQIHRLQTGSFVAALLHLNTLLIRTCYLQAPLLHQQRSHSGRDLQQLVPVAVCFSSGEFTQLKSRSNDVESIYSCSICCSGHSVCIPLPSRSYFNDFLLCFVYVVLSTARYRRALFTAASPLLTASTAPADEPSISHLSILSTHPPSCPYTNVKTPELSFCPNLINDC